MKRMVVLVTEPEYAKGKEVFEQTEEGSLSFVPAPADEEPLAALVAKRSAIGVIVGTMRYVGPLYASLPTGGIIARFGVGVDGIDRQKTRPKGIYLTNTPGVLDVSVAEHTVFLMGALARSIPGQSDEVRSGVWTPRCGLQLTGKTLALIGFGHIAREVARIAAMGFRMRIHACSATASRERQDFAADLSVEAGVSVKVTRSLEDAVSAAHFISIHLPLLETTRGLIDGRMLALMPKGAYLINTSRGGVVDEAALYDSLSSEHLAGAAFDVFANEPYVPTRPDNDLRVLKNVIMTPHIASSTDMSNAGMAKACVANILACIEGRYDDMTTVT